jgi:ribosomal protein S18 acetylase RimI-like enzyme
MVDLSVRPMSDAQVGLAVAWAAREGWNPGRHDAATFHAAAPGGFYVGLLDGEPVATISVVDYGERYSFVGFYIVEPAHRGQGFGLRLWREALPLSGTRVVGLDGVLDQRATYEASGFRLAYLNARYEGRGGGSRPADLVSTNDVAFDELAAYDRSIFGFDRDAFLRAWLAQPEGIGLVDRRADGVIGGWAFVRPCVEGHKVGPLFADDAATAERLLAGAASSAPGPLFLDVPTTNPAAVDLARSAGMQIVFETVRMYTGDDPTPGPGRVFGVTSFELG